MTDRNDEHIGNPKIGSFNGPYRFFSNYYPSLIQFEGIVYPTVEHAFQAMKIENINTRMYIARFPTPGEAKRFARHVALRPYWDKGPNGSPGIKFEIMESLVRLKFRNPNLAEALLATGDAILEEGNTWGDRIWGVDTSGRGENHLGKILMRIRNEMRIQIGM